MEGTVRFVLHMQTEHKMQLSSTPIQRSSSKNAMLWRHQKTSKHKRHGDISPKLPDPKFQAKATFKKAARKIISSLRVVNAFLSCLGDSSSPEKFNTFQYFVDIVEVKRNEDEQEFTGTEMSSPKPLFDPTWFKANREIRLGSETKAILSQEPSTRTKEQVQTVFRYLHSLPSFAEYPLYHQKAICQDASYQSFAANVTILKRGHRADNFYFVLSGSATVISNRESLDDETDDGHNSESVSIAKRGMAFGEAAIMNNSRRNVTVVSKTPIELLVVSKEDYARIFFGTDADSGKKEYISFLRTIDFLHDWPVDLLKLNPEKSRHCYFRRGAVIVRNSNNSSWLYVVKSGVCEVLVRLNAVKPRKAIGRKMRQLSCLEELTKLTLEQRLDLRNRKDKISSFRSTEQIGDEMRSTHQSPRYRRKTLCYVPELGLVNSQRYSKHSDSSKIDSITEEDPESSFHTESAKTSSSSSDSSTAGHFSCKLPKLSKSMNSQTFHRVKSRTISAFNDDRLIPLPKRSRSFSLPSTISGELSRISCRTKPAFVRIDLLHPKRVFGLSELDFEYNALHPGRPASVSLVSRGAECIMISKKFFMENANALTKRWIRLNVQPYLPMEKHQQTLQEKIDWETFKKKIVNSVVR